MALPLTKVPNDFPFKHSGQPDKYGQSLGGNFAEVQSNFDSRAEYNQTQINAIITALKAISDGDSGADNVGATAITGGVGTTVQSILEELNAKIVSLLPFPDGSITNNKLATDIKVGSLASLLTTVKTSVVDAINELFNNKANLTNPTFTSNINLTTINSKTPSYAVSPTENFITTGFSTNWSGFISHITNQENQKYLYLSITSTIDISPGGVVVYTLPLELRPSKNIFYSIIGFTGGGTFVSNSLILVFISTSGVITLYSVGTVTSNVKSVFANLTYY